MKTYIGERLEEGAEVYVIDHDEADGPGKRYPLALRLEIANHSPDGFEWGYGGSGPAQLALAILADHIGPEAPPAVCPYCERTMVRGACEDMDKDPAEIECGFDWLHSRNAHLRWAKVLGLYMDFKRDVIAGLEADRFELITDHISVWLANARRRPASSAAGEGGAQ
jgi:Family of unknown function (DUF6166)